MTYTRPLPDDLKSWINSPQADEAKLAMSVDVACDLLEEALGESASMPQSLYTYTALQIAHTVYKRNATTNGVNSFGLDGETVVTDPKDELNRVWHLVRRYRSPFPTPRDESE